MLFTKSIFLSKLRIFLGNLVITKNIIGLIYFLFRIVEYIVDGTLCSIINNISNFKDKRAHQNFKWNITQMYWTINIRTLIRTCKCCISMKEKIKCLVVYLLLMLVTLYSVSNPPSSMHFKR